jgi:hypothetical protein
MQGVPLSCCSTFKLSNPGQQVWIHSLQMPTQHVGFEDFTVQFKWGKGMPASSGNDVAQWKTMLHSA